MKKPSRRPRSLTEANLDDEIAFHLESRARELESDGLSPEQARAAALDAFGSVDDVARACMPTATEAGGDVMTELLQDMRVALRSVTRKPVFFVTAILTIALGVGPNTAIYGIFRWAHLGGAPGVAAPHELRTLRLNSPQNATWPWTHTQYQLMRDQMETITDLVAFQTFAMHVALGDGGTRRITAEIVAGDYFGMLGMRPSQGRFFAEEELSVPHEYAVAVVSHEFWSGQLGRRPLGSGIDITINGTPFMVIGVTPPGFHGAIKPGAADMWVPVMMHRAAIPTYPDDALSGRSALFFQLLGRQSPETSIEISRAEAELLTPELSTPGEDDRISVVEGAAQFPWFQEELARMYLLMSAVVGLVLLIACANLINLMLVRAAARRRETAVRLALGIGRARLLRYSLLEAGWIAVTGAAAGLVLAVLTVNWFEGRSIVTWLPSIANVPFDVGVFAFTGLITAGVALIVGVVPGMLGSRQDPAVELHGGRGATGRPTVALRGILAGGQVAISLVLLVGAGLFLQTVRNLNDIPLRIDANQVLMMSVDLGTQGYDDARILPFYRDLQRRLVAHPRIDRASIAWRATFGRIGGDVRVLDPGVPDDETGISADLNAVTGGYFTTLGLDVLEGRDFTDAEVFTRNARVLVVNRALADRLWPGQSPVGRRVILRQPREPLFEIVGVVEDAQLSNPLNPPEPMVYAPFAYAFLPVWATVHLRGGPGEGLAGQAAEVLREMDPALPVYDVETVASMARRRFANQSLLASLTSVFAGLALLLALVGLYGVVAFSVSQRMREYGIRVALGATNERVMGLVVRHALAIALSGTGLGLAAALSMGRVIESKLYGISPLDPVILSAATTLLVAGAVLAALAPARRATRVNPVSVLRSE